MPLKSTLVLALELDFLHCVRPLMRGEFWSIQHFAFGSVGKATTGIGGGPPPDCPIIEDGSRGFARRFVVNAAEYSVEAVFRRFFVAVIAATEGAGIIGTCSVFGGRRDVDGC